LAAPSYGVPQIPIEGSVDAALPYAASRLVRFYRRHPELHGEALLQQFISDETIQLPDLIGKVEQARALRFD